MRNTHEPTVTRERRSAIIRHVDGACEFAVDRRHLPVIVTSWFGSPTLALVEQYAQWFDAFVELSRVSSRRFVVLDDASLAERPAPSVRGRLSKIECPAEVVIDRVVVVQAPAIRGAITALSWITGRTITTTSSIEDGVRKCLERLDGAGVTRPRAFELEAAKRSR